MAPKTEPDPKPDPKPDGEPPDGDRMSKIEAEQAEQKATLAEHGGMLTKILDRLPGKPPDPAPAPGDPPPKGPNAPPEDIQGTVRREIEAANKRAADEAKAKGEADWRASVDETLEKLKPETAPREPQAGVRGRLQRAMFGSDR